MSPALFAGLAVDKIEFEEALRKSSLLERILST
jgi:hypothetical protein